MGGHQKYNRILKSSELLLLPWRQKCPRSHCSLNNYFSAIQQAVLLQGLFKEGIERTITSKALSIAWKYSWSVWLSEKLSYVSVFWIDAAKDRTQEPGHIHGADRWEAELQTSFQHPMTQKCFEGHLKTEVCRTDRDDYLFQQIYVYTFVSCWGDGDTFEYNHLSFSYSDM